MTTNFTIRVSANDGGVPVGTGPADAREQLRKLLRFLERFNRVRSGTIAVDHDNVAATGTVTAAAVANADTITINGVTCTAQQANATGTITCASVSDADTATVAGVVLTAKTTPAAATDWARGVSDAADGAALKACINANCPTVTAHDDGAGVVTIRAVTAGTGGNSITLATSNNTRLAKSGTTLANGAAIANNKFDYTGTNTETGACIAAMVAASSSVLISGQVTAANASGVVTLTAITAGTDGNTITLASSNNTRLAVSGARLTGGAVTTTTLSF